MSIIQELKDAGIVKTGEFTLKSGAKSNLYFDFKGLVSHPELFKKICNMLGPHFYEHSDRIVGVPMGGLPYASVLSYNHGISMLMVREEVKGYGLQKQIEGNYNPADMITIVEDVITSGGSVQKIIDIIEKEGLKVQTIVCILDRQAGGVEKLETAGYKVISLFKMEDFITIEENIVTEPRTKQKTSVRIKNIAMVKKTNLIVALDVVDPGQFFQILDLIGPYIAAVKVHIDLMRIGNLDAFVSKLNEAKHRWNFMTIEDRKYADIPSISIMQIERYQVAKWADMVTVHGIVGSELVKAIANTGVGIILVHQLSVAGNIIAKNSAYQDMVFNMGDHLSHSGIDISGFVSQEKVREHLTFSPGVNLDETTDGMGQTYTAKKNTDFYIVGRGITTAKDIKAAAERYRTTLWNTNN